MPNWVNNELTLYAKGKGGRRQLSEFRLTLEPKKAKLGEYENPPKERDDEDDEDGFGLDFNIFIPYPKKFAKLDKLNAQGKLKKDGFNNGGYEWRCSKWNTKWNACDTRIIKETEKYMKLGFDTAWSPPIPVIAKIAERYPDLGVKLKYWDCYSCNKMVWVRNKLRDYENENV